MFQPLSIYIHWPFCLAKCPYCDFNSHVREKVDANQWQAALLQELALEAGKLPGRRVVSVFFGGGTPSLMPPATVAALLEAVYQHWPVAEDVEITLEANPTSSEAAKFRDFRAAGVNRLSIGVQSLDNTALQFLGREHSSAQAIQAVEAAARIFSRYSFDLIYARPNQTESAWEEELRQALSMAGDHLSLYQLTLEPGTPFFHAHARGALTEIGEEEAARLYEHTANIMESVGMPAYEVSNYARPGGESRHNLAYWRYQDYIGIGPGAHGRWGGTNMKRAMQNIRSPEKWLAQVQEKGHGRESETALSELEQAQECLLMGLRLKEGVPLAAVLPALNQPKVAWLEKGGMIEITQDTIRVTSAGALKLNSIIAEIT